MIKVILFDFSFIRPSQMPILLNWNRKIMSHVQSHSFQLHRVPTQWCIICTNKHLLTQINFVAITAHFCQNAFCKIQTLIAFIACFLSYSYNCFTLHIVLGEMSKIQQKFSQLKDLSSLKCEVSFLKYTFQSIAIGNK